MAAIPGSVRVTGFIAPSDTVDTYATHDAIYGKDGWRSVANAAARNAITTERRREGMIALQQDTAVAWRLLASPWVGTDADWIVFAAASGAQQSATPGSGTTVLDTYVLADTQSVVIEFTFTKANVRYSATATCNHDGTAPYWTEGNIAVTPGSIDAEVQFDVSGTDLRLLAVNGSGGWTIRWLTREITT